MKLKNILKNTGTLLILMGLSIIFLLFSSVETIAGNEDSTEILLFIRGTEDVVAASNLGIGFLLIICSSMRYKKSLKSFICWTNFNDLFVSSSFI